MLVVFPLDFILLILYSLCIAIAVFSLSLFGNYDSFLFPSNAVTALCCPKCGYSNVVIAFLLFPSIDFLIGMPNLSTKFWN